MKMRITCPVCDLQIVSAIGPKDSPILICGEFPGYHETIEGKPFVGDAGEVLKEELKRMKLKYMDFRVTNLWYHETPDKKSDIYKECFSLSATACINESKGKKVILLLGSDCAKYFVGLPVSDIAGLRVQSPYLSAPIIICGPNPAACLQEDSTL